MRWQVTVSDVNEYSVDAYGKTKVLLHYHARNLSAGSHDAIHELGRAEQMDLDLVPHDVGSPVEIALLWKEEPIPDRMVFIRGPKGFRKNIKTDERGQIRISTQDAGNFNFRSSVEEPTPGTDNGEAYELVRHNITLLMNLPPGE